MYLSNIFSLIYEVLQIRIPLVLSETLTYSVSLFNILSGIIVIYIVYIAIKFLVSGRVGGHSADNSGKE